MLGFMFRTTQAAVQTAAPWRLVAGSLVAGVLAVGLVAMAIDVSPLCVLYTPDDPMWWLLGCWSVEPKPWPWP